MTHSQGQSKIDEGIIKFEMRPFPLDGWHCGPALVRAVPESKFFALVKMPFAKQPVWVKPGPCGRASEMARLPGRGR